MAGGLWGSFYFFFSSRRRHTRSDRDWSSDVCSSDLVESVAKWNQGSVSSQLQERKFPRDNMHDVVILFRLEAARAVDQPTSDFEQRHRRAQNPELLFAHPRKIFRLQPPAHIHSATHHAGIAAG